ncbi:MAG: hypothetical protein Q8Q23_02835 [bacterium]|nr:hypothetical protein [bacterium]
MKDEKSTAAVKTVIIPKFVNVPQTTLHRSGLDLDWVESNLRKKEKEKKRGEFK